MAQYFEVHPDNPQPRLLKQAAALLQKGGIVAVPTDSSYALVCHLDDKDAADRLRRIRQVDEKHHLTLLCRDLSELANYARVDNRQYRLLKLGTPGPYTFILEATKEVPRRVSHPSRKTIGLVDPAHGIAQRGPAVGHVAGLAFGEVFAKDLVRVAAHLRLYQKPRKVRAGDQLGVAHKLERTFVGAVDAHLRKLRRHLLRPFAPPGARGGQPLGQSRVVGVETQAHDVHRVACKRDGNFGAREVGHALAACRSGGAVLAANFVMVGQGPKLHAIGLGAGGKFFGREGSV